MFDTSNLHSVLQRDYLAWNVDYADKLCNHVQSVRSLVRYSTALFPEATLDELVNLLIGEPTEEFEGGVLRNCGVHYEVIMRTIRGGAYVNEHIRHSDVAGLLIGRHPGGKMYVKASSEIPIHKIQAVGKLLHGGMSKLQISKNVGLSCDTVRNIDKLCGFSASRKAKRNLAANQAVDTGLGIRQFSKRNRIPKSTARDILVKTRSVRNADNSAQ